METRAESERGRFVVDVIRCDDRHEIHSYKNEKRLGGTLCEGYRSSCALVRSFARRNHTLDPVPDLVVRPFVVISEHQN